MSDALEDGNKGEDKWKDIDNQISSMTDWIPNQIGSLSNQRQGHTHRRSEPDVVMIRKALPPQSVPVPSSAPVQPGSFVLDWSIKNVPSPGPSPLITTRHPADVEGPTGPAYGAQANDHTPKGYSNHSVNSVGRTKIGLSQGDCPSPTAINGPKAPPPYHSESHAGTVTGPGSVSGMPFVTRADSPSLNYIHYSGTHTPPIGVIPELSSQVHHQLPQSRMTSVSYISSPRSSRRSSAPGNQLDPRSHSASPNITRRSTSHSAAVLRSRTQENFSNLLPSVRPNERMPHGSHTSQSSLYFQPVNPSTPENVMAISASNAAAFKDTSTYDDQEYTKVLLQHQHERMERLRRELKSKKELLHSLTMNVGKMENEVFQKKKEKTSTLTLNDVTKLRDENRQIEIDCNCMIKEVESLSKSGSDVINKNFHEFIIKRNSVKNKSWQANDALPPPPLPPPPVPPPVEGEEEGKWSCSYCTFLNHAALNKCEMCEYRRENLAIRARHHRT